MPPLKLPPDTAVLDVEPWPDPVLDALGHDPRSEYVERFWLGTLGPSTVWLLRNLAGRLDTTETCTVDLHELARALGLTPRHGPPASLIRAIDRSCTFGIARFDGRHTLAVRRRMPSLSRRQIQRLPAPLRDAHDGWSQRATPEPTTQRRLRARQLAVSLLELGESPHEAERMLHRWQFHPAIAHEALRWARNQSPSPVDPGPSGSSGHGHTGSLGSTPLEHGDQPLERPPVASA